MATLTEQQVQALCDCFQQIDRNKDGFVDSAEIDIMIAETFPGSDLETQVAVRNVILSEGDTNQDGRIDIGEFLSLIAKRQYDALMSGGAQAQDAANGIQEDTQADAEDGASGNAEQEFEDPMVAAIMRELAPEDIDMYRDAFIRLDRNGDGFAGREEMMQGIAEYVGPTRFAPLREYLDKIFDVADRDRDNMLSLTEFLASFAHGPGVVPQDVVMDLVASIRVRLSDEEICALQESFRNIDKNQDGFIDADELFAALKELLLQRSPDLSDQAFRDIVAMVLESADRDHDGRLNLAEFIRSFQEDQGVLPTAFIDGRAQRVARRLTKDEVAVLKEAFKQLDVNNDGFVDYAEMYTALSETLASSGLNRDQVRDLVDLIMVTADRNKDGKLTLTEFIRGFVVEENLMTLPVAVAENKAREATGRLQSLLQSGEIDRMVKVFNFLDSNHDGFLEPQELDVVLRELLADRFPEWDENTIKTVQDAIISGADLDHDGRLSLQEFIQSFVDGAGVLPPEVVHEWGDLLRRELSDDELRIVKNTFIAMDTNHDGVVSRDELANALRAALGELLEDEAHLQRVTDFVMEKVDTNRDGQVSIREFVASFEADQGVLPVVDPAAEPEDAQAEETQEEEQAQPAEEPAREQPRRPDSPVGKQLEVGSPASKPAPISEAINENSTSKQGSIPELATSPIAEQHQAQTSASTPKNQMLTLPHTIKSPIVNDVSGVAISEEQLLVEFRKYDRDGRGYLDRNEFKRAYLAMENFGLEPSQQEIDRMFRKYGGGDDKVSFNEFCVLMLTRSRM